MRRLGHASALAFCLGCPVDNSGTGGADESSSGPPATSSTDPATSAVTSSTDPSTTAGPTTGPDTDDTDDTVDSSSTGEPGNGICLEDGFVSPPDLGPDYPQFGPTIGTHCLGTDHQDIAGFERVVFLGDSITVGTPPSLPEQNYRSVLALALEAEYDVSLGSNSLLWFTANPFDGTAIAMDSGDFSVCARWGARNDDLLPAGGQLETCFPPELTSLPTLTIITSGGNDLAALTKSAIDGASMEELQTQGEDVVDLLAQSVDWLTDEERFPNGNYVIYGNLYEFTDGTGDVEACDVSGLAGFDMPVPAPDELKDIVIGIEEQYLRIAVEAGVDMIFMLEEFCGHGFNNEDPTTPCYRGPGTERWFDLTCIHPNAIGHQQLSDMFMAVVQE